MRRSRSSKPSGPRVLSIPAASSVTNVTMAGTRSSSFDIAEVTAPARLLSSAKPATAWWGTAGAWTAEPARARAHGTVFARPGLADRQGPAFEGLLIESSDGFFRDGALGIIDECEASRPAGFPVDRQNDLGRCADARQVFPQIYLVRGVRQIAYKQTD